MDLAKSIFTGVYQVHSPREIWSLPAFAEMIVSTPPFFAPAARRRLAED